MSSEGPADGVSNATLRLGNLRLNQDDENIEEGAVGVLGTVESENSETFDSPYNMQTIGGIVLNRARRAFSADVLSDEQPSTSCRSGASTSTPCEK